MSDGFSHSFLETLFWNAAKAQGTKRPPDQIEHEGHTISRTSIPLRTNSGKNIARWSVSFTVKTPEGISYSVDDEGYRNRRNDSERNWGLGRE